MRRVSFPWETDRPEVETLPTELDAVSEAQEPFPGARDLARRVAGDPDPHRARRGARGAANALHEESKARGWGMDSAACRDRVNTARARSSRS